MLSFLKRLFLMLTKSKNNAVEPIKWCDVPKICGKALPNLAKKLKKRKTKGERGSRYLAA